MTVLFKAVFLWKKKPWMREKNLLLDFENSVKTPKKKIMRMESCVCIISSGINLNFIRNLQLNK